MPAGRTGDDWRIGRGPSAVLTEVHARNERRPAGAPNRRRASSGVLEQPVELVELSVEVDQLRAALVDELFAEPILSVHLE